jgi:hypothetical protein
MESQPNDDFQMPDFPPTDETGDVDVSLIESNLRLTPAERIERHYGARLFVQRLKRLARERYGPIVDDLEALARSEG